MPIRLSGMNSGLDTDAIVQELVAAYSKKTETYKKSQTKIEWKQEAWKSLNSKVYSLYTNVSNLRFESAYDLKKTNVSDNTKATVSASSQAVTGTQKLNILETSQAGYLTGGKLGDNITESSTLEDLGYTGGDTKLTLNCNGETKEIAIKKTTKISELVKSLQAEGVNASFDTNNKRIFISAKESGVKADFVLQGTDSNSKEALKKLGLDAPLTQNVYDENGNVIGVEFTAEAKEYQEAYDTLCKYAVEKGIISKENLENLVKQNDNNLKNVLENALERMVNEYNTATEEKAELESQKSEIQQKIDEYDTLDKARKAIRQISIKVQDIVPNLDKESRLKLFALAEGGITSDDLNSFTYGDNNTILTDEEKENLLEAFSSDSLAQHIENLGFYLARAKTDDKSENALVEDLAAVGKDFYSKLKEEKQAELENKQKEIDARQEILDEYDKNCEIGAIIKGDGSDSDKSAKFTDLINKSVESAKVLYSESSLSASAVKISGADAKIKLNGVEYTNSSNSFSINGLNINAQVVTGDGDANAISITTSSDVDGIYDTIKNFLTEYNTVINEITKLYNADSARDYQPLTDEEKDAMSETEVEKWEKKIKDSLLRRDSTLSEIMSAMTNTMSQSFEINGKNYSLSNFGIETLGFLNSPKNEQYAYHIDGDEDDTNTSGKEDKLRKAITEDSESVMKFMQELTKSLYTAVDNKMKSTELSSAYKVYNDKELDSQYKDYTDLITKWEQKVSDKEEYYYKKFSQMEVALSKIQNQTNSLAGLLGS